MKSITKRELMGKLGEFIRVENAESRNGCGSAPNQFIIQYQNGEVFQSYHSLVGARIGGQLYFSGYHDYSNTTSGHCKRWCGFTAPERRKGLETGQFIYIDL